MLRRLISLALLALLAACGGGSDEPFEPPPAFIRNSGLQADYGYVVFQIQSRQGATPESVYIDLRPSIGTYIDGAEICIRESGSTSGCGGFGTTKAQIIRASGGKFVFDVSSLRSVMSLGRVYQLDLEIIIDNSPYYWRSSDSLQLSIEFIEYFFDGFVETVDYRRSSAMSTVLYPRGYRTRETLSGGNSGKVSKKRYAPHHGERSCVRKMRLLLYFLNMYTQLYVRILRAFYFLFLFLCALFLGW